MYRWYSKAAKCYAYLSDHEPGPTEVLFYAKDWSLVGSRFRDYKHCADATGINKHVLHHNEALKDSCVTEKFSWAWKRKCRRIEDHAHSLFGLFGISMSMVYGEGEKAFIRLQEEIVRTTCDKSIFAWTKPSDDGLTHCGLLSLSLSFFESGKDIIISDQFEHGVPYPSNNLGMCLRTELIPLHSEPDLYLLPLVATHHKNVSMRCGTALYVKRLSSRWNSFARVDCHKLSFSTLPKPMRG